MKRMIGIGLATWVLSAQAWAASQPGATVYPGARPDAAVAAQLKKAMNIEAQTYRTGDSVEKVAAFYRAQKLKEQPGTSKTGAMFTGPGVTVTVQNPWSDMESGKINNDTLVSIVKGK